MVGTKWPQNRSTRAPKWMGWMGDQIVDPLRHPCAIFIHASTRIQRSLNAYTTHPWQEKAWPPKLGASTPTSSLLQGPSVLVVATQEFQLPPQMSPLLGAAACKSPILLYSTFPRSDSKMTPNASKLTSQWPSSSLHRFTTHIHRSYTTQFNATSTQNTCAQNN